MPIFNKVENGFFIINEKDNERRENTDSIPLLEEENADLWFDSMLNKALIKEHDNELADVWYLIMTGGEL